uniref:hypothetical protein n=1 Tax=Klebsiella pneumoniae TaxID=573 RepID=UPI001B3C816E|nr:hypothetical protein [Klebsiella pneumoniae]
MGEISVKTGNNARNGGKNSLNRLIRCVCGKKIGPDPRNFNQRVSLGRNDLLIRTFPNTKYRSRAHSVPLPAPAHQDIIRMTEQPWSCTVTCKPAGIDIPQTRQDTGRTSHSVLFPENSVNHPVNCDSH